MYYLTFKQFIVMIINNFIIILYVFLPFVFARNIYFSKADPNPIPWLCLYPNRAGHHDQRAFTSMAAGPDPSPDR